MECLSITELTLEEGDIESLKAIRKISRNLEFIKLIMPAGVMYSLFFKNHPVGAAYNISTHEWHGFTVAMSRMPSLERKQIIKAAKMRALDMNTGYKQRQFWKAVVRGCEVGK